MTDEKFTFIDDVRSKKKIATGAYHKRTHCGKSGAVKFPSDYMTEKERKAMNGEVKSYKLNDPMTWKEFKAMPEDIKIAYIKALRDKYGVSDSKIFEMLGISQATGQRYVAKLGIALGKGGNRFKPWDKDGWYAWVNGVPKKEEAVSVEPTEEPEESGVILRVDRDRPSLGAEDVLLKEEKKLVPYKGGLTLKGSAEEALNTIKNLLGCAAVKLTVTWEELRDE